MMYKQAILAAAALIAAVSASDTWTIGFHKDSCSSEVLRTSGEGERPCEKLSESTDCMNGSTDLGSGLLVCGFKSDDCSKDQGYCSDGEGVDGGHATIFKDGATQPINSWKVVRGSDC